MLFFTEICIIKKWKISEWGLVEMHIHEQSWTATYKETYLNGSSAFNKNHLHTNMHQLIYVVEGECNVCVSDKMYHAGPKTLIVFNNIERHWVRVLTKPYKRYVVDISGDFLRSLQLGKEMMSLFNCRTNEFRSCMDISDMDTRVRGYLDRLVEEDKKQAEMEYTSDVAACVLKLLLIELFRTKRPYFPDTHHLLYTEIYPVKQYLDKHYAENITMEQLSELFHISKSGLTQKFRDLTGDSPKHYLMLYRLAVAKSLLYSTELSVSEVAEQTGFGDVNNFIRYFKNDTGVTPLHYRKVIMNQTD